jgi:hypothetical protein
MRRALTVLRGVSLVLAAVAFPIPTSASDLPTLDTYSYCVARIQRNPYYHLPTSELEAQLDLCFGREGDSKRDARWRLRMIPRDDRQKCIDEGIAENSYRAIGQCLDRFTGYLRG